MSKNKLTKLPPAWHDEAIELLKKNFAVINSQFLDSTKKAVWLGIFLNEIKAKGKADGSIPHGTFLPWMEKQMPDISIRQAQTYMSIGKNVCEKGDFQIRDYRAFATGGELPPEILKLVEGKSQKQLCLDFKQVDDDGNPAKGQKKGSKGCTKEMRLKAKYASEKEELEALESFTAYMTTVLKEKSTLNGFPRLDEVHGGKKTLEHFAEAVKDTHLFLQSLKRK